MFSPGNLRATFDNPAYEKLISYYIGEKYTLRYTGGMVRRRPAGLLRAGWPAATRAGLLLLLLPSSSAPCSAHPEWLRRACRPHTPLSHPCPVPPCPHCQVPDVFQIIVKEKGVFTNVISPSTKAKLRLLFEVAPLALLVEKAGGASSCDGLCVSGLDVVVDKHDQRTQICYGSVGEVRSMASSLCLRCGCWRRWRRRRGVTRWRGGWSEVCACVCRINPAFYIHSTAMYRSVYRCRFEGSKNTCMAALHASPKWRQMPEVTGQEFEVSWPKKCQKHACLPPRLF